MSDSLVLDTDVASYLFKNSSRAKPFRPMLKGKRPALAFVSVAELFKWTLKRHWGPRKIEQLETALRRCVVIPYDRELAWAWARVVAACEDAGRPIAPSDAWVAAAALRHDVPLPSGWHDTVWPCPAGCWRPYCRKMRSRRVYQRLW
jgi:tRNA(fMet)-specific endonuclease VapC